MYKGKKMEEGNVQDVLVNPKHPYTQALIASVPTLDFDKPPKVPEMMDFSV